MKLRSNKSKNVEKKTKPIFPPTNMNSNRLKSRKKHLN